MIENAARFDQGFDPTTCVVPCLETYRKSMGRIAKGNDGAVSTRFAHSCTVVVFVVIQYSTVSTPRSTRPGSLVSWLPKSGDSYIKPQYWKLVGETRGPLLDISNGRCPSPVSMTWPLRSSALQILYVISTAFFNATEIPVSTCHNSWTKWALIIIVLRVPRVLLNAWETGSMKTYFTPGPWRRHVSVRLLSLIAPLVLTCRSSRAPEGS